MTRSGPGETNAVCTSEKEIVIMMVMIKITFVDWEIVENLYDHDFDIKKLRRQLQPTAKHDYT